MPSACVHEHNQEQACERYHVIWDDDATENIVFPHQIIPILRTLDTILSGSESKISAFLKLLIYLSLMYCQEDYISFSKGN